MSIGPAAAFVLSIGASATAAAPLPDVSPIPASAVTTVVFSRPAQGTSLREGEIVEIRWSGVPKDAKEIELLLSVDGGAHYPLRLTDELDPGSLFFLWRVPSLATDSASLAIRAGIHGREVLSEPGPLFRISRHLSSESVSLRWKAGEIWIDQAGPGNGAKRDALFPSSLSARPERITSVEDDSDADELPRSSNARPAPIPQVTRDRAPHGAETPVPSGALSRAPRSLQQRI